jgi:glutamate-1-semialdehyde 2,1-aminomutase
VYQAGTLSGNPLAMAAGLATLEALHAPGVYEQLEDMSVRLADGIRQAALDAGIPAFHTRVGSMGCTFFQPGPVTDYTSAVRSDTRRYAAYFHGMLQRGIYLAPAQYEAWFMSLAHTAEHLDRTLTAAAEAFAELQS